MGINTEENNFDVNVKVRRRFVFFIIVEVEMQIALMMMKCFHETLIYDLHQNKIVTILDYLADLSPSFHKCAKRHKRCSFWVKHVL